MRVGFIGLGSQGGPMARAIADAGFTTTLWARRAGSLEAYADLPAAATPAALGAACDLVCVCVIADADVTEVLTGENGVLSGMAPGGVVAVHSTVHPDTCRTLATAAAAAGVALVDAPVSGGGQAAAEGRLLVMAGGEAADVARCRPVFEAYAGHVVHLGPVGAGQVAKLVNNVLFSANLATAADALSLGGTLGADPARLAEVLGHGSAASFGLGAAARGLDVLAAHAGHLLRKDVRLAGELAAASGTPEGVVMTAADAALAVMGHPR